MIPPKAVSPNAAAATWAVVLGARTIREVGAACGWASPSTAHLALLDARKARLVAWESDKDGTLRPRVGIVARHPDVQ